MRKVCYSEAMNDPRIPSLRSSASRIFSLLGLPIPPPRGYDAEYGKKWRLGLDPEARRKYQRDWEKRNPERRKQAVERYKKRLEGVPLRRYGLSVLQYRSLWGSQGGACAICFGSLSKKRCLDHCHRTGKVRGFLCARCNNGLGLFGDSTFELERAISYLKRYE